MATIYTHSAHCVGESNWHLQFTPAYRRPIFGDQLTRELTVAYLIEAAQELNLHVGAIDCGPDHIHLFIQETRKHSVIDVVQKLKGSSSYKMRKRHWYLFKHHLWGNKFWSAGYFYQTVGAITAESVKKYVAEGQQKHWVKQEKQQTLFNYSHQTPFGL